MNTSNILFICGGAFADLEKIIRERSEKSSIGFGADIVSQQNKKIVGDILREVEPEDLIRFGLIPEFVGRLPVIGVLDELDESALVRILQEPKNALVKQYKKLFHMDGVEIEFSNPALVQVANKALKRKSGARGLRSILEHTLLDVMYEMPSLKGLKKVVIDETVIEGTAKPILIYENPEQQRA